MFLLRDLQIARFNLETSRSTAGYQYRPESLLVNTNFPEENKNHFRTDRLRRNKEDFPEGKRTKRKTKVV